MGFGNDRIIQGLYTADTELFELMYEKTIQHKLENLPKRFLYVGRYVEWKGVFELWKAFSELKAALNSEWELWCVGTGELYDQRIESEGIKHFGFIQPQDLTPIIEGSSVFVLPSKYEPWGVVTQEYAAAGLGILSNKNVGSTSAYLRDGENGILLNDDSYEELKKGMRMMMEKTDAELIEMGKISHELGKDNSPKIWADKLLSVKL
mgnify:CR=1 FL=1